MDISFLVPLLGPALWEAFKILLEKGSDLALDKGVEPLKDWIASGYDERKDAENLRAASLAALNDLKEDGGIDQYDALFATLKLTGLDRKTQVALAGTAIEMTNYSPDAISSDLLKLLDLDEKNRALLARFLFMLRIQLLNTDRYKDGIHYANEMENIGQLRGITNEMMLLADKLATLVSLEDALIRERRLTTDDAEALKAYLAEVRQKWEGILLPLIRRKKTGADILNAKIKQVFVPLKLRDVRAEEEYYRRLERITRLINVREVREEAEPKKILPMEIGEMLNSYPRFILIGPPGSGKTTLLNRVALAFAEGRAAEDLGWKGANLFPIFLRLRNFGSFLKLNRDDYPEPSSGTLIAYLENQFREGERLSLTADFFDRRLAEGNCIVLLDGLDEVSELRSEVAHHIDAFVERYGMQGNRVALGSRPRGYATVELPLRRVGLAVAEVTPLDIKGITQLLHNLLKIIEPDPGLQAHDLGDLTRSISASAELTRLAGTPLFCSALVQVYKYNNARLPHRRVDIFDEIVDLLLGNWHAQQRRLSEAEHLGIDDGTGKQYRDVRDAVTIKHRRLSYLADAMQQRLRRAEISKEEAEQVLIEYLKGRERVHNDEIAQTWAENFLINSHERSGLLVEQEPEVYSFLHKGFMEYLAATALVNQSKTLVETLLANINDQWWEQVILLAGAHPRLAEDVRVELINSVLDKAEALPLRSEQRLRHIIIAGGLARDMAEYLPGSEHERVENIFYSAATDSEENSLFRASAADMLDELGYQPDDLYHLISIPDNKNPKFLISKYPITNAQYERFLKLENFQNKDLWRGFPMFDINSGEMKHSWDEKALSWLNDENKENGIIYPNFWGDPRFGIIRRSAPVVGISWYEANAYCKWLMEYWDELAEGKQGFKKPEAIRLPTEWQWAWAAGGEELENGYPWDKKGVITTKEKILQHANVRESGIGKTTPVWMYPQGASQYTIMDMAGNVWEWQANYSSEWDGRQKALRLRGSSGNDDADLARTKSQNFAYPDKRSFNIGFRVAAFLRR